MYDSLLVLQAQRTGATTFQSTAVDLKTQTPRRGLVARVLVPSYSVTAAGTVFTPSLEHSTDNTTFTTLATGDPLTATTAAQAAAPQFIPCNTTRRYVRLVMTLSVATGAPSVVYSGDLGLSRP